MDQRGNQFDSLSADMMSDLDEPMDDPVPNYSPGEVYPEDEEHWRQGQIEMERGEE